MTYEQKMAIENIKVKQIEYKQGYIAYMELEKEIDRIVAQCQHESFKKIEDNDDYEGRRYWHCICNDCGHDWHERRRASWA